MFDFHEKRKLRRIVYSKPLIVVVFILAGFVGHSAYERYEVEREMATRLHLRNDELALLKERATHLDEKVVYLHDERGIEEELRSRFDVVKEGEQVAVIVDDAHATESVTHMDEKEVHSPQNASLVSWFLGIFER